MTIREYAKEVGFPVVGKLLYLGRWAIGERYYMDEACNVFVVNTAIGGIRIIPKKKREET